MLFFSLIIPTKTLSQLSSSVNYSIYYDDNPFRQIEKTEETVNMLNVNLDYQPLQNEKFYLSYFGGVNSFNQNNEYSYQMHSLGSNYNFNFSDSTQNSGTIGGFYSIKSGISSNNIFDFINYSLHVNSKIFITGSFIFTSGYIFSNKNYKNLSDLNFSEHLIFLRISKFFETKTGIIFEPGIGYKNYSIKNEIETPETYFQMRRNRRLIDEDYTEFSKMQARISFKISQGIFDQTGINFHYLKRINLRKNDSFGLNEYFGSDDEELWDDPYNFEGNEFGSEFTQNFPLELSLKLSAKYSGRNFGENYIDSIFVNRSDNRTEFWAGITKSFSMPFVNSTDLTLEYMFINNKSNRELFNYKNNLMMLSARINF